MDGLSRLDVSVSCLVFAGPACVRVTSGLSLRFHGEEVPGTGVFGKTRLGKGGKGKEKNKESGAGGGSGDGGRGDAAAAEDVAVVRRATVPVERQVWSWAVPVHRAQHNTTAC